MAKLDELRNKRKLIFKKLSLIDLQIKNHHISPLDRDILDAYVKETALWMTKLDEIHEQILIINPSDLKDDDHDYDLLFDAIRVIQQGAFQVRSTFPVITTAIPTATATPQSMKLPTLELTPFYGDVLEWTTFKDVFEAAIHNSKTISKVEKFTYLKGLVKGEAERCIGNLVLTDANYDLAWKQLNERYQHPRKITIATIRQFRDHPKVSCTATSIKSLLDEAHSFINSMELMGFKMDTLSEAMIVFDITYKLDEKSKDLWEHTIAHKNMPKFQDLTKFLEVHAAALESTEPRHNKDRKSNTYFTRSDGCKFGCKESHPAYRCPKLKASTVPKRREMVGNSNLCFNCLSSGHTAEECRSKYKCTHCSELHSSLLHQ
jgi:hypothetical protein